MRASMTDHEAILAAQSGDSEAFAGLVRKYERAAYRHALALLRRAEDARDAVQDSFLAAFRALRRLDARRSFYPWFYVVLRNRCYAMLRARAPTEKLNESDVGSPIVAADEDAAELGRALACLAPEDREMLVLKYIEGRRYSEIAELLAIPPGTVASRLHVARQRLADQLRSERRAEVPT